MQTVVQILHKKLKQQQTKQRPAMKCRLKGLGSCRDECEALGLFI